MFLYDSLITGSTLLSLVLLLGSLVLFVAVPTKIKVLPLLGGVASAMLGIHLVQSINATREAHIAALPKLPVLATLEAEAIRDRPESDQKVRYYALPGQDLTQSVINACIRFPQSEHARHEMFVPIFVIDQDRVEGPANIAPAMVAACEMASYS